MNFIYSVLFFKTSLRKQVKIIKYVLKNNIFFCFLIVLHVFMFFLSLKTNFFFLCFLFLKQLPNIRKVTCLYIISKITRSKWMHDNSFSLKK